MIVTYVLTSSIILQLIASIIAFRLIRITGKRVAWILISIALASMAIRRMMPLYNLIIGDTSTQLDLDFELVGLLISLLLTIGVIGITPVFHSIKKSEEALRISALKYRIVADNTYSWEFWLNPEGHFVYSSPSCKRVTGYNHQNFLTDPSLLLKIIHPDDKKLFELHRCEASQKITVNEIEFRITHKDGNTRWLSHSCQPIIDEKGIFIGTRGSNRDISENKRQNEEREKLVGELKEALASIKTLSGLVPICSSCKKIRDDQGYWHQLEQYIMKHSDAKFTHGICPECREMLYPSKL